MPTWGEGALLAGGAPVTVPRDPARDAARQELLNPAYHRHDPSLIQRIGDWFFEQIGKALDGVGTATTGTTGLVLFLIVAVVLVAAVWWRLGAPGRAARTATELFDTRGPLSADGYRAEARRHAAAGRWSEAVREQMRALVRSLEERTLLDPRPGRTADEAAAEAGRTLPQHAAALTAAARTFDAIAFGDRPADQGAYQLLSELDQALERTRPTLVPAQAHAQSPEGAT
ncbi:DUF4129 domain-containing protein [Kitasatospora sp. NPDC057015]|uniref:DUF4129 domain-containing protein n=1 Tax=Kitasatospora sp. NPDC057015 TaxID=3346001 RepID=UPI003635AF6B